MHSVPTSIENTALTDNRTKNYNGIDLIKFICSILVIIIHIPPFQADSFALAKYVNFGLQKYICRIAVPFFFVSSGFFLFRKTECYNFDHEVVKKYCLKILQLLGVWSVLLAFGGTYQLWYLGSTVVAIILLCICLQLRMKFRYMYILAFLLYGIGMLGDSYSGLAEPLKDLPVLEYIIKGYQFFFSHTRNGVFMGFIFVLMGATFAHREIKIHPAAALFGFAVSMAFLLGEVFILKYYSIPRDYNMYVFLLPAVFFLFAFACNIKIKDHCIFKWLRIIGVLMYFMHLMIYQIVAFGIHVFDKFLGIDFSQHYFIFSVLFTFIFATLIARLSNKEKFKLLKLLYS